MSSVDDAFLAAQSLEPAEKLQLISRLCETMSAAESFRPSHSGLVEVKRRWVEHEGGKVKAILWEEVWAGRQAVRRALFDRSNTSKLYSAPRRFDLFTIFVVMAAYSILFAGMGALGFQPLTQIVLGGLVAIVAVAQALLLNVVNPRGASVVVGAAAYTIFSLVLWSVYPRAFPDSFFVVAVINGLLGGALMGYLAGVLVGGVFLLTDVLRGNLKGSATPSSEGGSSRNAE